MRKVVYFLCRLLHGPQFGLECWVALWDKRRNEVAWATSPQAACARKIEKTLRKGAAPPCSLKAMESDTGRLFLPDACCRHCLFQSFSNNKTSGVVLSLRAGEFVYGMFSVSCRSFETKMTSIQTFLDDMAGIVSFELFRMESSVEMEDLL